MNLKGSSSGVQRTIAMLMYSFLTLMLCINHFGASFVVVWCVLRGGLVRRLGSFGASFRVVCMHRYLLPAPCSLLPRKVAGIHPVSPTRQSRACILPQRSIKFFPAKYQILFSEIPDPSQRIARPIPANSRTNPNPLPHLIARPSNRLTI